MLRVDDGHYGVALAMPVQLAALAQGNGFEGGSGAANESKNP